MDKLWMAPNGLHVEPAETQDAQRLAQLHQQGFFRGWPVADFIGFLADPATPAYIACDARRRIAGFALIRLVADESELLTIAVDPKWRGKGVGKALLDAVFADLMMSPARKTLPPGASIWPALPSMRSWPAPQTQGRPMPRATTAAWLVMPPRAVRMPAAACIP